MIRSATDLNISNLKRLVNFVQIQENPDFILSAIQLYAPLPASINCLYQLEKVVVNESQISIWIFNYIIEIQYINNLSHNKLIKSGFHNKNSIFLSFLWPTFLALKFELVRELSKSKVNFTICLR